MKKYKVGGREYESLKEISRDYACSMTFLSDFARKHKDLTEFPESFTVEPTNNYVFSYTYLGKKYLIWRGCNLKKTLVEGKIKEIDWDKWIHFSDLEKILGKDKMKTFIRSFENVKNARHRHGYFSNVVTQEYALSKQFRNGGHYQEMGKSTLYSALACRMSELLFLTKKDEELCEIYFSDGETKEALRRLLGNWCRFVSSFYCGVLSRVAEKQISCGKEVTVYPVDLLNKIIDDSFKRGYKFLHEQWKISHNPVIFDSSSLEYRKYADGTYTED